LSAHTWPRLVLPAWSIARLALSILSILSALGGLAAAVLSLPLSRLRFSDLPVTRLLAVTRLFLTV
jgi:hypothetical protein